MGWRTAGLPYRNCGRLPLPRRYSLHGRSGLAPTCMHHALANEHLAARSLPHETLPRAARCPAPGRFRMHIHYHTAPTLPPCSHAL